MAGNKTILENEAFMKIFLEARTKCYNNVLSKPYPNDGMLYCNATMDLFGCWNYTLAGTRSVIACPDHLPGFNTKEFAYKDCTENGTWWVHPQTGRHHAFYDSCRNVNDTDFDEDHRHVYIFIAGYSISLAMLFISLFIFFKFRQLRCDRITIHKNLFISYIVTGVCWILYFILVVLNGDVLVRNPVWCQVLHVFAQYAVVSNFAWMFCEGLYLHTVMMKAFTSGKWIIVTCYVIGWGVPTILSGVYTALRAINPNQNKNCWHEESSLQWIMFAPIVLSLALNLFFLCNIVRILITKLRQIPEAAQTRKVVLKILYQNCIRDANPSTNMADLASDWLAYFRLLLCNRCRKAARATLILIPLLGLQFLLFPMRPARDSSLYEPYNYAVATFISLQGSFVSFIYCFCNGEVLSLLKRKWNQHKVSTGRRRSRAASSTGTTLYTLVEQNSGFQTSSA